MKLGSHGVEFLYISGFLGNEGREGLVRVCEGLVEFRLFHFSFSFGIGRFSRIEAAASGVNGPSCPDEVFSLDLTGTHLSIFGALLNILNKLLLLVF